MAKSFPSSRGLSKLLLFLGSSPDLTFPDSFQAELVPPSFGLIQQLIGLSLTELITLRIVICLLVYIGLDHELPSGRDSFLIHLRVSRT